MLCHGRAHIHTHINTRANQQQQQQQQWPCCGCFVVCVATTTHVPSPNARAIPQRSCPPSGTMVYLAPEVVRGKYAHAADVWSAGIITCLLLTGRLPFSGEVRQWHSFVPSQMACVHMFFCLFDCIIDCLINAYVAMCGICRLGP